MLPVSQAFTDAVRATTRRVFGRVQVDYTDPFLDQSVNVTTNEQASASFPQQVADALLNPTHKYASLDGSWVLDGTYYLAPETELDGEIGWWGSQLSGVGGVFAEPYPKLTIEFFSRPVNSLKVVGDSLRGEYPVDFEIVVYGADDAVLHTETITGNTDIVWTTPITPVNSVIKMTLEITKWSHAGRQVKILEFFTSIQQTYEGDDIISINLLEEREVSQGSLPIGNISANEIDIKLNNIDNRFDAGNTQSPLYQLLKANRRIKAWLGVKLPYASAEYVPLGVFWSGDWEAPETEIYAHTSGRDRMELLRKTDYSTSYVQTNVTLYDLAEAVLIDAGLTSEEYWIDTELQNYIVPYAWFTPQSHREALRKIVEACMGQAYCNRDGIVRVEGSGYIINQLSSGEYFLQSELPAPFEGIIEAYGISADDYFDKSNPVKWSEIANYIEVETAPLRPAAVAEEIYRSNEAFNVTAGGHKSITAYYNSSPCIEAVASLEGATNTTISAVTYYAWGANITLSNSGGAAEDVTVVISGKPLKVLNKEKAIAQDTDSITDNGKLKFTFPENNLIQTLSMAQIIADGILASYKDPRRDITLDWRGNPALELADIIVAPDYKDNRGYFYITSQTLDYDGGLSSKITGRRI